MAEKSKVKSQRSEVKAVRCLWLAACGLSLLVSAGCEKTQSELFKPRLAVHCLLLAWDGGRVYANVNRTYAIDETVDTVFTGADVVLWCGSDTWRLAYEGRDRYSGVTSRYVVPYDTWRLRVAKPGFDTVYGSTVVPDTFTILYPAEGETVNMSDSMGWTRSRNCRGYDIALSAIYPSDTFYYDVVLPNDTSSQLPDSLKVHVPQMFFMYGYDPGDFWLPVLALDTNYYDWVSAGGFGPGAGGGDTTHLVGGVGVFGSALMQEVTVYHQPDATGPRGAGRSQNSEVRLQKSEWREGTRRERGQADRAGQREGRVGLNALRSGSGVVSARGPFLVYSEPFRDRGQQLLALDRLVDERVGPGLERGLDVFLGHAPGENQDWCLERPGALEHRAD